MYMHYKITCTRLRNMRSEYLPHEKSILRSQGLTKRNISANLPFRTFYEIVAAGLLSPFNETKRICTAQTSTKYIFYMFCDDFIRKMP